MLQHSAFLLHWERLCHVCRNRLPGVKACLLDVGPDAGGPQPLFRLRRGEPLRLLRLVPADDLLLSLRLLPGLLDPLQLKKTTMFLEMLSSQRPA